jgi:polynucleotide 5'-hydroxyl-kinase GRC3/NOL9
MTELHIPKAWREHAATILETRPRVILVLGGSDRGKSSYCRFLAAELLAAGHRVAIVDADLGQKDVGPPATVALGYVTGTAERWTTIPEAFYFVGSTSPVGRMLPLIIGTTRLVSAADAAFVIVDTSGYIEGAGRVLKGYKIDAVRPDLIVAIEKGRELESILRSHASYRTIRIHPSRKARPTDRWERDLIRQKAFAAYFKEARRLELGLDDIVFQRSLLFTGEPTTVAGALYAERTAEGVVAVAEGPLAGADIVKRLKPGFERGLLCGVTDEHDGGVGLAVLESINFEQRRVLLTSPVPAERLKVLQFGDLYVDLDGRELGRVDRAGL